MRHFGMCCFVGIIFILIIVLLRVGAEGGSTFEQAIGNRSGYGGEAFEGVEGEAFVVGPSERLGFQWHVQAMNLCYFC